MDPPLDRARTVALSAVTLRASVPSPGKIICVGLNYRSHINETGRETPQYPVLFTKFAESLIGPSDDIVLPAESHQVDWEGELAVIMGRAGRRIPEDSALDFVGGYAVANDITMRDYQYKTHQWLQGKTWERSTPLGPYLTSADEVGDPSDLELSLSIDGEMMQSGNTSQLLFDIPRLISVISEFVTLSVGDVIMTGTPEGVGFRREPKRFLRDGETVRVEISRVGAIENRVVGGEPR
ncbi:fumarylacetoacetate hydrolase family protein [Salinibacterium sp. NK8237]|uniref:fumarylacetoacetate hydrolase family protein n=1 Tax=Salinibacterium sp. NK8237 TaxID=2792038 RepID=UPI001E2915FD|nr:fumarylacetoacetate hydrolase family protein [Salinibacterium sp. NK8237]